MYKKNFKLVVITALMIMFSHISFSQGVAIKNTNATPNSHAILDIDDSGNNKGILIPRLTSVQRIGMMLGATEEGLTVYDETTKSYWFYDGSAWVEMTKGGAGWLLAGNALSGGEFIGTTTNDNFSIRTNNLEKIRITTKGQIEVLNTGRSVFIGEGAGASDDLSTNNNSFVGYYAGNANTTGNRNTANGAYSLMSNTTAALNTAYGFTALRANTTGTQNTASGANSMSSNTTGSYNTAFGNNASNANTVGANNTAIGNYALSANTASDNTSVGAASLYSNTSGNYNTATGSNALFDNTTASNNTANGYQTLANTTTGYSNTAVGANSLFTNTTGFNNTAIGTEALNRNTTGYRNIAIGSSTLFTNTAGHDNIAQGYRALYRNITGYANIGIGYSAMDDLTYGNYNTAIGFLSGNGITTGHRNITIGYRTQVPSSTASYQMSIGNLIYGVNVNGSATAISTGNIGIGVRDPDARLEVNGQIKVTGGGPATGDILTCQNALGLAYWAAPGGGGSSLWTDAGTYIRANTNSNVRVYDIGQSNTLQAYNASTSSNKSGVFGFVSPGAGSGYGMSRIRSGIKGYGNYHRYSFGVAGYKRYISNSAFRRSGGVFGAYNTNTTPSDWGALGYYASNGNRYGGYFAGGTGLGVGKSKSTDAITDIGIGVYGDLFGAEIHGQVYGTYTEGTDYGIYSHGNVYTDGLDIHLQESNDKNDKNMAVLYSSVSTSVTVQTVGTSKLNKGTNSISLDKAFINSISSKSTPIIIVTLNEACNNSIFVTDVTTKGFTVQENNNGASDVLFSYIVIAQRAGYEKVNLPKDVIASDYNDKLSRGLHNDTDIKTDGKGLYYENGSLIVGNAPLTEQELLDISSIKEEESELTTNPQLEENDKQITYYDTYGAQIPLEWVKELKEAGVLMFTYDQMMARKKEALLQSSPQNRINEALIESPYQEKKIIEEPIKEVISERQEKQINK